MCYLKRCAKRWWAFGVTTFYHWLGKTYQAKRCGHRTKLVAKVEVFEENYVLSVNKDELDYCPHCLAKMAVRCGCCSSVIFIGDPVILYRPRLGYSIRQDTAVYPDENGPMLVVWCQQHYASDAKKGIWALPGKAVVAQDAV